MTINIDRRISKRVPLRRSLLQVTYLDLARKDDMTQSTLSAVAKHIVLSPSSRCHASLLVAALKTKAEVQNVGGRKVCLTTGAWHTQLQDRSFLGATYQPNSKYR